MLASQGFDRPDRWSGRSVRRVAAAAAFGLVACGAVPRVPFDPLPVPAILQPLTLSDVTDLRGKFRNTVCAVAAARKGSYPDERPCENMLHDLGGEAIENGGPPLVVEHRPASVLIVPGIFGECVSAQVTPFSDGLAGEDGRKTAHPYAYLENLGYRVDVVPTRGRASSEANAALIEEALLRMGADKHPVIVVAYSKGVPDTLEALRQMGPGRIPKNLRAVVSVAGVVAGTPIADRLDSLYEGVLSRIPFPGCAPASSDPIASLSQVERLRKLQAEIIAVPKSVRLYSLVAFAQEENVTTALRSFYKLLAGSDPRNDGQIIYHDAVLPRSRLLGYVNSDHWAFALAFDRANKPYWRTLVDHNAYPREILLEAILLQVQADTTP
jgi:hypothetical protein